MTSDSPVTWPQDQELVRRAQAGEELAFETLVKRHEGRAYRVARNLVPSEEDARDLAQEAFLRVFKSLERFDFQHEFTTWLYRIVTNLAIDHLRRRRPVVRTSSPDEDEPDIDLPDAGGDQPSSELERRELQGLVRECLDNLPPHFKTVLALRELEGLSCIKIAEIVGATHVTVRWRLHRGRKLFQEEWERRERLSVEAPELLGEGQEQAAMPWERGDRSDRSDLGDLGDLGDRGDIDAEHGGNRS